MLTWCIYKRCDEAAGVGNAKLQCGGGGLLVMPAHVVGNYRQNTRRGGISSMVRISAEHMEDICKITHIPVAIKNTAAYRTLFVLAVIDTM